MRFAARSVRLITNREGRATGQAFVEFPTQAEAEAGLAMDRQMMGSRYVEAPTRALPVLCGLSAGWVVSGAAGTSGLGAWPAAAVRAHARARGCRVAAVRSTGHVCQCLVGQGQVTEVAWQGLTCACLARQIFTVTRDEYLRVTNGPAY